MHTFWLCDDCLWAAAYDDYSALALIHTGEEVEQRYQAIENGLRALGPLSADVDVYQARGVQSFAQTPCDCCHSPPHGPRHRFTQL